MDMGKFDGILLVSDLDGTLLRGDQQISSENRSAIAYFESEGGRFSYISGRVARCLVPVLEKLRPSSPVGCNNGMVYDANAEQWVDFEPMSREVIPLVNDIVKAIPSVGVMAMGYRHVYICRTSAIAERFCEVVGLGKRYIPLETLPEPYCKVLLTHPEQGFEVLQKAVDEHPLSASFELVRSDPKYYEIMPKGCNKGHALESLAKHLNISMDRTIAVGDNENDITMFQKAAIGVAVANASPVAKAAADLVLSVSNEEHAIADLIHRLDNGTLLI